MSLRLKQINNKENKENRVFLNPLLLGLGPILASPLIPSFGFYISHCSHDIQHWPCPSSLFAFVSCPTSSGLVTLLACVVTRTHLNSRPEGLDPLESHTRVFSDNSTIKRLPGNASVEKNIIYSKTGADVLWSVVTQVPFLKHSPLRCHGQSLPPGIFRCVTQDICAGLLFIITYFWVFPLSHTPKLGHSEPQTEPLCFLCLSLCHSNVIIRRGDVFTEIVINLQLLVIIVSTLSSIYFTNFFVIKALSRLIEYLPCLSLIT